MGETKNNVKIALDAFGGDSAPEVNIRGALEFVQNSQAEVILTGPEDKLKKHLGPGHPQISIHHAPDIIDMAEKASGQLRRRTESSMYQAIQLVAEEKAQACISAGSSAAQMALSLLLLKRLKDVERPALITPIPNIKSATYCLDMGANVDCKPLHLVHFALMGHAYVSTIINSPKPRIGLLSNGEEESKGNDLTRETHSILKTIPNINYAGYCEGRDIFTGEFDVVVCDGFVGNIVLKTTEGLGEAIVDLLKDGFSSSLSGKVGYLIGKNSLRPLKDKLNFETYGGAPLLGIGGLSFICHGRSSHVAIRCALQTAETEINHQLVQKLGQALDWVGVPASEAKG